MLFFTTRKKLNIINFVLENCDLSCSSCVLLYSAARFSGASILQARNFVKVYREYTGARADYVGFIGHESCRGEELISLRKKKLTDFKYLFL